MSALRTLRLTGKKRVLWNDRICINQNDLAARSAQVRMMTDVSQFSAQTIIWLGEDDIESSAAIDFMEL